jgi:hypothetical protein
VYVKLTFDQIAIVRQFDSALVQVSVDTGRTWRPVASYLKSDYPEWNDGSADAGDWKNTTILWRDSSIVEGVVLFRFRLVTNNLGDDDGWYLDNIQVNRFAQSVEESGESYGVAAVVPNPVRETGWIVFPIGDTPISPDDVELRLFDLVGRPIVSPFTVVREGSAIRIRFDLSDQLVGRYFWRARLGNRIRTGTIVVAR